MECLFYFKAFFAGVGKANPKTEQADVKSLSTIAITPPVGDMHGYIDDSLRNLIIRDVQRLPVADAVVVTGFSPPLIQHQNQAFDALIFSPFRVKGRAESQSQPMPLSIADQRSRFIATLPPPPPPPVKRTTELTTELLPWTRFFQDDLADDFDDETPLSSANQGWKKLSMEQFLVLSVLGEGAQGTVYLVKHRAKMVYYALKAVRKDEVQNAFYGNLFTEQFVLRMVAGDPLFLNLQGTFQDDEYFYILTDLYARGDLGTEMREVGKYEEKVARRYAAQIALSIEALHKRHIIHRDIKPDNLFLNSRHDIVLGDFGLCRTFGRTVTEQPWREAGVQAWTLPEDHPGYDLDAGDVSTKVCGTPRYIAPEVYGLNSDGRYSYAADIFSFGVILYEMLYDKLPFEMKDDEDVQHLILRTVHGQLKVDNRVSAAAADLLRMVLEKDPSKRPSWEEIKAHSWFRSVNWDTVSPKSQPPTPIMFDHPEPTDEARAAKFGKPLSHGDALYPFFDWTSPELNLQPSVSTTSMYEVSRDWTPTADILAVMGWPVDSSHSVFTSCPPVKPVPAHHTPTVVPGSLSTHKSYLAIVVDAPLDGPIALSELSSPMSSTSSATVKGSQQDIRKHAAQPECDSLICGTPALSNSSCSIISFDSDDIAKAMAIMDEAIQDIPLDEYDDDDGAPINSSLDAILYSPTTSTLPGAISRRLGVDVLSDLSSPGPSSISGPSGNSSIWESYGRDGLLDADATDVMSPTVPSHPSLNESACLGSRSRGSSDTRGSTSTAETGSSTACSSRPPSSSSRASWGKLKGKVEGWWSSIASAGSKGAGSREERRAFDASW